MTAASAREWWLVGGGYVVEVEEDIEDEVVLGDRRAVLLDVTCLSSRQREQPAYGDSAVLLMRSCCGFVSPA